MCVTKRVQSAERNTEFLQNRCKPSVRNLLALKGLPRRFINNKRIALGLYVSRYRFRTAASGSGMGDAPVLALLLVVCRLPRQAERRMNIDLRLKSRSSTFNPKSSPARIPVIPRIANIVSNGSEASAMTSEPCSWDCFLCSQYCRPLDASY